MADTLDNDNSYNEEETVARREAALKRMLSTPHVANPKRELSGSGAKRGRPPKPQSSDAAERFRKAAAKAKPAKKKGD